MKEKNFKKLGFFSAISICIGSIVGIGIFFKNGSIAKNVEGDGTAWLLSWIISGIIALLVAIHFGRIAMVANDGQAGLSSWSQKIATKKENWFRHTVTVNYSFFYNSIMLVVLSFFTIEIFVQFLLQFNPTLKVPMYVIAIFATLLTTFYILMNKISIRTSGGFSQITTILKFIPLMIAAIVGIVLPNTNNMGGNNAFLPIPGTNSPSPFSAFQGIMRSLPAALFAFDAFVGVGSLANKIKGGEKVVSKVIVFSMLFVVISYLLISISAILHFNPNGDLPGSIQEIITNIFGSSLASGLNKFVLFFLFISAAGTTNAIASAALSEFENISRSEKIFFSKKMNDKWGYKKTAIIYLTGSLMFWSLIAFIPAIVMNSDAFIDALSNFPVFLFFLVYATLIFLYWKNIFMTQKAKNTKRPLLYTILVFISVIGVVVSIMLSLVFVMVSAIEAPFKASAVGFLFAPMKINNLTFFIIHIVFIAVFIILPLINYLLFKLIHKQKNIFSDIDLEVFADNSEERKSIVSETRIINI